MSAGYDFRKGKRGAVLDASKGKTRITIRIDNDVLDWFRSAVHEAGGGNYQTLINDALRRHVEEEEEPLEDTVRRVLREELPSVSKARRAPKKRATRSAVGKAVRSQRPKVKKKTRKKESARRKRA